MPLQRFIDREGHARVPFAYRDEEGYPLGSWVNEQRTAHHRGKLTSERVRRLEAQPGWKWLQYPPRLRPQTQNIRRWTVTNAPTSEPRARPGLAATLRRSGPCGLPGTLWLARASSLALSGDAVVSGSHASG
jgi:hypothetical protein